MKDKKGKKDNSKSTVLIIAMGFLVIYLISLWKRPENPWMWAVYVSLCVGILGAMSSFLSKKMEWAWMKLAKLLEYIVPNVLLSLVFYLILFPVSLLSKLSNKDPLMLSKKHTSYFVDIDKEPDIQSFEKLF